MKIIRGGNGSPHDKSARFICYKCGARIEARKSEGVFVSDWRDGDYVEMKCPQCGYKNNISADLFQLD